MSAPRTGFELTRCGQIRVMGAFVAGAVALMLTGCRIDASDVSLHASADGVLMPAWSDTSGGSGPHCRRPLDDADSEYCLFRFAADIAIAGVETPDLNRWRIVRWEKMRADGSSSYIYGAMAEGDVRAVRDAGTALQQVWVSGPKASAGLLGRLVHSGEATAERSGDRDGVVVVFNTRRALETALLDVVVGADALTSLKLQGVDICSKKSALLTVSVRCI